MGDVPEMVETRLGRVLRDALLFADLAAGEERGYYSDAGFEIHSMDLCIEFAAVLGVEPCSDAYYAAIKGLAAIPDAALASQGNGRER